MTHLLKSVKSNYVSLKANWYVTKGKETIDGNVNHIFTKVYTKKRSHFNTQLKMIYQSSPLVLSS